MKCMKYSNENNINIIPQADFEELTHTVFNVIASNLSKSLGPLGSSATIFDGGIVEATKDGYSILNKYNFNNKYKKMIYNLIRTPCTKMNNTVGDGTTTAITLTHNMFNRYQTYHNSFDVSYRLPRQLTTAWDEVISEIISRVKKAAVSIDPEDYDTIYHLAYVTSNGNKEISDAIANAYHIAKTPAIKIKDSSTNKSYLKQVSGFEFPADVIDTVYVRNQDLTATEKNIKVVILDHKMETDEFTTVLQPINEVLRSQEQKLLILAPAFDEKMLDSDMSKYVNYEMQRFGKVNMILAQYKNSKLQPHQREDLATILRTKVLTNDIITSLATDIASAGPDVIIHNMQNPEDMFYRCIGEATTAMISMNNGSIFEVDGIEDDDQYKRALALAEVDLRDAINGTDYEAQAYSAKTYEARSRLLQLQMKNFIYYIGADSRLQKQILHDAVDDVVKCLKSAVKNGVVPGCQLTVIKAATDYYNELNAEFTADKHNTDLPLKLVIAQVIRLAAMDTYLQVLVGPEGTGILKTIPRWMYTKEEGMDELVNEANEKAEKIIQESIDKMQVFDLETLEYNPAIITSAETDTMVLSASSDLIKILISGNQCVFIDPSADNESQDEVEAYV